MKTQLKTNESFFRNRKNYRKTVRQGLRLASINAEELKQQEFTLRCRHCNAIEGMKHAWGCPKE